MTAFRADHKALAREALGNLYGITESPEEASKETPSLRAALQADTKEPKGKRDKHNIVYCWKDHPLSTQYR